MYVRNWEQGWLQTCLERVLLCRNGPAIVSAAMVRAGERCCAFLRRESCEDVLTCDRCGAPTTTLRKLQITLMMIYDMRYDAVTYGDMLRACDDDDAAVMMNLREESVISTNTRMNTHATDTRQFAACRYLPASRELGAKRRPAEKSSLNHCLHEWR